MKDVRKTPAGRLQDDILTPTNAIKLIAEAVQDEDWNAIDAKDVSAAMVKILRQCDRIQEGVQKFCEDFFSQK